MPKLSIITINYENLEGLRKTVQSIFEQTFTDYEYIIIDGGSTDGSKEYIENYKDKLAYRVSEKDNGIYNAQNKGIAQAKGDYLIFMNSGDVFINKDIIRDVSVHFDGTDIIYGDTVIKEKEKEWIKKYPARITFSHFFADTLPHQASFISTKILSKLSNRFDESLEIIADWKFFVDAIFKYNASVKYLDLAVTVYDFTGLTSKPESWPLMEAEKKKVLENEYPHIYNEVKELLAFKKEYSLLSKSRFVKFYQKCRKIL